MPRIAPLEPPYPPPLKQAFDSIMQGAPPLVLFRTLATSERAWRKFTAGSLLDRGPLTLRERELVIDRTTALAGCEYEWGVHVQIFAQAAGLTSQEISATADTGSEAPIWTPAEGTAVSGAGWVSTSAPRSAGAARNASRGMRRAAFSEASRSPAASAGSGGSATAYHPPGIRHICASGKDRRHSTRASLAEMRPGVA